MNFKKFFATLATFFIFTANPSAALADEPTQATFNGSITALGQTVDYQATYPIDGGHLSGSFSGACSGSIDGSFYPVSADTIGNVVHATLTGQCDAIGIQHSFNIDIVGRARLYDQTVTVESVSGEDVSVFISLPLTLNATFNTSTPTVAPGTIYSDPNSGSTIVFTQLPANPGNISFSKVDLTPVDTAILNSASAVGYEINSTMSNGSFIYDLTLPLPAGFNPHNLKIKYSPDSTFSSVQDVTNTYIINSNNTITVQGLNHLTVFIVSDDPTDPVCVLPGSSCFATIQEAVDAAQAGDTIIVNFGSTGIYNETVTVNKALTLNGVGTPTIETLRINVANVYLDNIAVVNLIEDTQVPTPTNTYFANIQTGFSAYAKDGDVVKLFTTIQDDNLSLITPSMITANLSGLGGGVADSPFDFDPITGVAYWIINVSGNTNEWVYVDIYIEDAFGNSSFTPNAVSILTDNIAPTVSAGSDQVRNNSFIQVGTSDDSGSGIYSGTEVWSQISGPGVVTFGTPNSDSTSISASQDGVYVIQLSINDYAGHTSTSTFTLTWDTTAPVVSLGGNQIKNSQFNQTGSALDATSGIASITWNTVSGPGNLTFSFPNSGSADISADTDGTYVISLTAIDYAGNQNSSTFTLIWDTVAPVVNVGGDVTTSLNLDKTANVSDAFPTSNIASVLWSMISGPGTITFSNPNSITTNIDANADGTYIISLIAVDNAGNSSTDSFTLVWDTVVPQADPGVDQVRNAQFSVTATISDAAPSSGIASIDWVQYSGPGTLIFGSPNSATTTISADVDGIYTVQIIVFDNAGNGRFNTFELVWDTTAPVVNAGSDQIKNASFVQNASASDFGSGLNIATEQWSQVSGPGVVTFGTANAVSTTISADQDGTYIIQFSITDIAGNTSISTFTLVWDTVSPVVTSGPDHIINGIFTQVGSQSDASPSSGIASITWSKISGPGVLTFGTPNNVVTTVSANLDGNYVVGLTVIDMAGNSTTSTFNLTWDTVPPVLNPIHIASNNSEPHLVRADEEIDMNFSSNETILILSTHVISRLVTFVNTSGNDWSIKGMKVLVNDEEGPVSFVLKVRDLAGNLTTVISTTTDGSYLVMSRKQNPHVSPPSMPSPQTNNTPSAPQPAAPVAQVAPKAKSTAVQSKAVLGKSATQPTPQITPKAASTAKPALKPARIASPSARPVVGGIVGQIFGGLVNFFSRFSLR